MRIKFQPIPVVVGVLLVLVIYMNFQFLQSSTTKDNTPAIVTSEAPAAPEIRPVHTPHKDAKPYKDKEAKAKEKEKEQLKKDPVIKEDPPKAVPPKEDKKEDEKKVDEKKVEPKVDAKVDTKGEPKVAKALIEV